MRSVISAGIGDAAWTVWPTMVSSKSSVAFEDPDQALDG